MAGTVIAEIENKSFPELTIPAGTFVVWRNNDPVVHSAETRRDAARYFTAGALHPGEASSPVYFAEPGEYKYLCRFHADMTGSLTVTGEAGTDPQGGHGGHHGGHAVPSPQDAGPHMVEAAEGEQGDHAGHLRHYHGFVTGGRTSKRLYMTHTPVFSDERHCYQIILQGSLIDPEQARVYDKLRWHDPHGAMQIFHRHLDLTKIRDGEVTELPEAFVEHYPAGVTNTPGESVDGLPDEQVRVRIDRVLHFRTFEPDSDYPDGLAYLMYGDEDDVFIDHFISRAPNFHSVAKLRSRPEFFSGGEDEPLTVLIPSKAIRDVSPKTIARVAFVDNRFHLFWLPPPGINPLPVDPLSVNTPYEVTVGGQPAGTMEVGQLLHFDTRILNYGVLLPDE